MFFSLNTFLSNFRDCFRRKCLAVVTGQSDVSLCRKSSLVRVLFSVIEQTAQNINDSLPMRGGARQQSEFSIRLFQADLYFHGDTVHNGTGQPNLEA